MQYDKYFTWQNYRKFKDNYTVWCEYIEEHAEPVLEIVVGGLRYCIFEIQFTDATKYFVIALHDSESFTDFFDCIEFHNIGNALRCVLKDSGIGEVIKIRTKRNTIDHAMIEATLPNPPTQITPEKIAEILESIGFEYIRAHKQNWWYVVRAKSHTSNYTDAISQVIQVLGCKNVWRMTVSLDNGVDFVYTSSTVNSAYSDMLLAVLYAMFRTGIKATKIEVWWRCNNSQ